MNHIFMIAAGGAIGAVLRFWVSTWTYDWLGREFPYGTLMVNVVGSLLMGLGFVLLMERLTVAGEWRPFILIGLLGAFTTFSTFSMETLNLLQSGALLRALLNVLLSVVLCVFSAWLGVQIGRQL